VVSLEAGSLFSLEGRTALLTGSSGFLGRTFARTLLSNGARLIAVGRSERLDDLTAEWARDFGADRVRSHRVDMYDIPAFSAVLDEIATEEAVDVLVNNAYELGPNTGFNTPEGALEAASLDQWTRHFTSGVFWPALTVQKLGPGMIVRGKGSIINISTMYAVVAPDPRLYEGTSFLNPPGYSAAKAAMLAFTRYVASFWGEHGLRANAILPGPFSNTEEAGSNSVAADDPFIARLASRTSLRRPGRPDELAGALLYLASDASSYVTGQAVIVDGGWTAI
jgi:NAD(P)-dependent dehydrogenase (short-subunit alcohol dehydrogenase family)